MKKSIIVLLGVLLIALPSSSRASRSSMQEFFFPEYKLSTGGSVMFDRLRGIYHVKPSQWDFVFTRDGYTNLGLKQAFGHEKVYVNAGYFGTDDRGFFPAGHLAYDSALVDPEHCKKDPNLCGFITLDDLTIHQNLAFTRNPTIAAGPIMMFNGVVNRDLIKNISHRQRKTHRTLLIQTSTGPVFLVSQRQYSLPRMLAYSVKYFGRNISVINLDGGSSSTLLTDNQLFTVSSKRRLPTFFILE